MIPETPHPVYMNDNDRAAAAWVRDLWPRYIVDERSIQDILSGDVQEYRRVHLFCGIGGWEYALHLAGWPEDRPVWTGSCPYQPFSSAGARRGESDERHLWPQMLRLVRECRPPTVFGEQVASRLGREWITGVRTDLESLGYRVGVADLPAACVGSPHIRQRLFWVADAQGEREGEVGRVLGGEGAERRGGSSFWSRYDLLPCRDGKERRVESGTFPLVDGVPGRVGLLRGYGNAIVPQVAAVFIKCFLETEQ